MSTIHQALVQAVSQLKANQDPSTTPRLDAELLLAKALQRDKDYLLINSREEVSKEQLKIFTELLARRLAYEPVAYILGKKEFWGLEFLVNQNVLIPRPDTEVLVEQAILSAKELVGDNKIRILELGTGSGCIAISLASELEKLQIKYSILAVDKSIDALSIAKENLAKLMPKGNIDFQESDWFDQVKSQKFDLIISNPPYVNPDFNLQPELGFEPELALYSQEAGLEDIKKIIEQSKGYLSNKSKILIEYGPEQSNQLNEIAKQHFTYVGFIKDLTGLNRVLVLLK